MSANKEDDPTVAKTDNAQRDDSAKPNLKFNLVPKTCAKRFPGSLFNQLFAGYEGKGMVQSEPGGLFIGSNYPDHAEEIFNCKLRSDDIWLLSQSKCGKQLMMNIPTISL